MRRMTSAAIALVGLIGLGACGDDDGGGGADIGDRQQQVADQTADAAEEFGFEVDRDCLEDLAAGLSDDDAQLLLDAGPEGDPELSEAGDAIGERIEACFTAPDDVSDVSVPDDTDGTSDEGADAADVSAPLPGASGEITDEMIDLMVQQMEAGGLEVDRDCVADALEGMDAAELTSDAAMSPEFIQQFMGCFQQP